MKPSLAQTQYRISAAELEVVLALARGGTLAAAGERLRVDASTVFRVLQRIERALGRSLFERTRQGYVANDVAHALTEQAERVESALEAAQLAVSAEPGEAAGSVRITSTDAILHGLIAPTLPALRRAHPRREFELHTGNELASLTRRDADIAVRATSKPPPHLVGKEVGSIRLAVYAARRSRLKRLADVAPAALPWIAPDDALPEHPSVRWRRKYFPKAAPVYRVSSILTVMELVALNLGVGVLPVFIAGERRDLVALTDPFDDFRTGLWLLTHPESRHLRRVAAVYRHLGETLRLP
jgi:DNA-binding transcriptional LysR family regulator